LIAGQTEAISAVCKNVHMASFGSPLYRANALGLRLCRQGGRTAGQRQCGHALRAAQHCAI